MNYKMPLFYVAIPEIFMLSMICLILLIDVFLAKRFRNLTYSLVQCNLAITFVLVLNQYMKYPEQIVTFSGHYVLDKLAILTKLFVLITGIFSFIYARHYIERRQIARSEYFILGL